MSSKTGKASNLAPDGVFATHTFVSENPASLLKSRTRLPAQGVIHNQPFQPTSSQPHLAGWARRHSPRVLYSLVLVSRSCRGPRRAPPNSRDRTPNRILLEPSAFQPGLQPEDSFADNPS